MAAWSALLTCWFGDNPDLATTLAEKHSLCCYRNVLDLALSRSLHTLAFPAISTGVYGFPREQAAQVVSHVLTEQLLQPPLDSQIRQVRLIFFRQEDAEVFLENQTFPA